MGLYGDGRMKSRRSFLAVVVTLSAVCSGTLGSDSNLPSELSWSKSADSDNGKFTAVLRWSLDANECVLEVLDANARERTLIWKNVVPLKYLADVFVSDDGNYVVMLDRPKEATGNALEFYSKDGGRIRGYTSREVFKLSQKVTRGIAGATCYNFFYRYKGITYFCSLVWGSEEFHWLVWDAAKGELVQAEESLTAGIREEAREQFKKEILQGGNYIDKIWACMFLLRLKRPEDRVLIEKLLADDHFFTNPICTYREAFLERILGKVGISIDGRYELEYFFAESGTRQTADKALSEWDGKVKEADFRPSWGQGYVYYRLGEVSVKVVLSAMPKNCENLRVYLIPESVKRDKWDKKPPIHYLLADFDGHESDCVIGRTVPCVFKGVTPGKYWLKAVWDREEPFCDWDEVLCKPQKGDCESVSSPAIEVKAGQKVDAGKIRCNKKVKRR